MGSYSVLQLQDQGNLISAHDWPDSAKRTTDLPADQTMARPSHICRGRRGPFKV